MTKKNDELFLISILSILSFSLFIAILHQPILNIFLLLLIGITSPFMKPSPSVLPCSNNVFEKNLHT